MKILLSSSEGKSQNYVDALEYLDAVPVGGYLPEKDGGCDALLLCGGNDVHPKYYGEEICGSRRIDLQRDERELELLELYKDRPIFGICRGCQIINVFFGGTLEQHIATADAHVAEGKAMFHKAVAEKDSTIERLYGHEFLVNSYHHQVVKQPAPDIVVTARSADDGVIEGISHKTLPIFGVQWHPELTTLKHRQEGLSDGIELFREFLKMIK